MDNDEVDRPTLNEVAETAAKVVEATANRDLVIHQAWRSGASSRDLARSAGLSHTTVNRIIRELEGSAAMNVRDTWSQYQNRYSATRPGTFKAYVDVWQSVGETRRVFSGWASFSQAANAEPAQSPDRVQAAERCLQMGGYELGPLTGRGARQWRPRRGAAS